MANTLLTISDITREALAVLHEEAQLLKSCSRKYDSRFARSGGKIGTSVDIRKPVKYSVTSGADLTGATQDSLESAVTLTMDKRKTIGMTFTSEDLTLKIDDFSQRFLRPAVARLARQVDLDIAEAVLKQAFRVNRSDITAAIGFQDIVTANAQLSSQFANGDRNLYIDAFNDADVVNANKGLFQSSEKIASQYEKGVMGIAGGFKFIESESLSSIAFSGTLTAGAVNDASAANGDTTITLDGITGTATSIKKGQAFTIAGVYQVDPETLTALPRLYPFVAAADATITGGAATVTIANAIYAVGYANKSQVNISALPANDAAVTFLEGAATAGDSAPVILGMAMDSVAFASVDLELPNVSKMEGRESYDGVSMRIVKTYDGLTDEGLYRLDLLYGIQVLRPEHTVSMIGKV